MGSSKFLRSFSTSPKARASWHVLDFLASLGLLCGGEWWNSVTEDLCGAARLHNGLCTCVLQGTLGFPLWFLVHLKKKCGGRWFVALCRDLFDVISTEPLQMVDSSI